MTLPEAVPPVAGLGQEVGAERDVSLCLEEVGERGVVEVVGVEVVDDLRALVTEEAMVFEAGRARHAPPKLLPRPPPERADGVPAGHPIRAIHRINPPFELLGEDEVPIELGEGGWREFAGWSDGPP